ncbi:MAG TPA: hypothetical protein VMS43_10895 [Allosphingosinicella sp.]|nr:hypothetical protein [Allosphingosinicella sp.]
MNFLLAALVTAQVAPVTPLPPTPGVELRLDTTGSCEGQRGSVDMRRVMFLENQMLVIDGATGPLQIEVEGENFSVEEIGEGSGHRTYAEPMDGVIEPDEDLDIELKLALVDGRLALYWRETYRNRFYRQGLLTIEGRAFFNAEDRGLRPLCEGRGGSRSRI